MFLEKSKRHSEITQEGFIEEYSNANWLQKNMGYRNTTILASSNQIDEGQLVISNIEDPVNKVMTHGK